MALAGFSCLAAALAICVYGIGASLYGARNGRRDFVASGRRAVYALAGMLAVAMAILQAAFVRSDFSFELVATHSSSTTPLFYRLTAVWSSQEGSLLLWVLLLALWSSAILFLTRRKLREVAPYATAVLLGFGAFFCFLLVFLESPFTTLAAAPAEGTGLNPLLRHPSMMIHPPMLYSGYTLFAVPFAFAVGALVTRRLDAEWIRSHAAVHARRLAVPRLRDHARRALGLHGARLGRLLGLGPGRERLADALAHRHGVPALRDDPGEARDAEGLERLAGARHRRARDPRHVPRALRDPGVDPRVRRVDARDPVPGR